MKYKSCYSWFPNGLQYSLHGRIWSNLISNRRILILPHFIEGAQQNVRTGGGYALHSDSIKFTTQLKTSKNSWEHRKTPKIIWYHPENNWGPLIDNLVQFEEDFNRRTEKWRWGGVVRLSQTSPIPRSPDGDNNPSNVPAFTATLPKYMSASLALFVCAYVSSSLFITVRWSRN